MVLLSNERTLLDIRITVGPKRIMSSKSLGADDVIGSSLFLRLTIVDNQTREKKKTKAMFLFFLLSFLLFNGQQPSLSHPFKHIFILAGQSNMAGRGGVKNRRWDRYIPPESQPNPSILRLNAQLQWEEAHEPLHADIDVNKRNGIGPGMAFANAVRANVSNFGIIGLVPCAIGGTSISKWQKGQELYQNMVRRAMASTKDGGSIRAVLWYQGEADTVTENEAHAYKGRIEKFITDLRSDLGILRLPVVQVALASGKGPYIEKVREAQKSIDLPSVTWVDAKGLPLNQDHLHLTTQAEVQVGKMLADSYLKYFAHPQQHLSNISTLMKDIKLKLILFFLIFSAIDYIYGC